MRFMGVSLAAERLEAELRQAEEKKRIEREGNAVYEKEKKTLKNGDWLPKDSVQQDQPVTKPTPSQEPSATASPNSTHDPKVAADGNPKENNDTAQITLASKSLELSHAKGSPKKMQSDAPANRITTAESPQTSLDASASPPKGSERKAGGSGSSVHKAKVSKSRSTTIPSKLSFKRWHSFYSPCHSVTRREGL